MLLTAAFITFPVLFLCPSIDARSLLSPGSLLPVVNPLDRDQKVQPVSTLRSRAPSSCSSNSVANCSDFSNPGGYHEYMGTSPIDIPPPASAWRATNGEQKPLDILDQAAQDGLWAEALERGTAIEAWLGKLRVMSLRVMRRRITCAYDRSEKSELSDFR